MIEKEAFIAALLPICDTVCEYDRARGKLRVRKTSLASGLEDKWYTVEELWDIFRDNGGVSAEKSVWMRYLSSDNLRSFFYEKERNESFRLRFRQGGVGCRQYDIRIDRINDYVLVISGRDTQAQEIDALTGALSRNHYQREMSNEIYRGGVALIDMDDLKLYNDMNGHQVGDNALRAPSMRWLAAAAHWCATAATSFCCCCRAWSRRPLPPCWETFSGGCGQ